ncbi:uncharacterized protein LOC113788768 [Dermatophagoides pteronyssinus]|uniref:uncharacterized protein LOC113788768 n=1 Tax=Dermatophagoides pteronyssinus TaxID=6956 RepID=UPI003F671876
MSTAAISSSQSSIIESDLRKLISQARRLPSDDLEPCKDWTRQEIKRAQKLSEKINCLMIKSSTIITSELFNESRDCCNQLDQWIKRLEMNLKSTNHSTYHTLADLGKANQTK